MLETNLINTAIKEALKKQLLQNNFDIMNIIPLPHYTDRFTRLQTLKETLEDIEDSKTPEDLEYFLQIRPKSNEKQKIDPINQGPESIYFPNGKINAHFLIKNGDILFEFKEYSLAKKIYKTILISGESTAIAHQRIGKCCEAEGQLEEAKKNYEQSIAFQPSYLTYQLLSSTLMQLGKDLQAIDTLTRALHLKGLSKNYLFEIHKKIGECWIRSKKIEEAEKSLLIAVEINPESYETHLQLGDIYYKKNEINNAKKSYQEVINLHPKNYQALSGIGLCYVAEKNTTLAHDYFYQSLYVEINNPKILVQLITCAYEIKSFSKTIQILEKYSQNVSHPNIHILYSLANLQYHIGKLEEAKKTIRKILNLDPNHIGACQLSKTIQRFFINEEV